MSATETETETSRKLASVPDPGGVETDPIEATAAADPPEEPAEEPKPTPPMQIALPGDWASISGEFGGAAPETSEIRLLGGKMPIEGSFAKGTEFDIVCRVKVTGVLGQDVTDDFGKVTRTVRRHMARLIAVQRVNK